MAYNYSWNDSPAPVTPSNISSLPLGVQKKPPLPPHLAGRGATPADTGDLDFSVFGNGDVGGTPQGPSGPAPSTPVQGNPFFNFLSSLFNRSGGPAPQGAPQGMTGLLQRGRGSPGTDSLGNPFGRFG